MKIPSIINTVRAWNRRNRISYELNSMSERALADVGITRADVANVARGRFKRAR